MKKNKTSTEAKRRRAATKRSAVAAATNGSDALAKIIDEISNDLNGKPRSTYLAATLSNDRAFVLWNGKRIIGFELLPTNAVVTRGSQTWWWHNLHGSQNRELCHSEPPKTV